jgi:hypothetical protein
MKLRYELRSIYSSRRPFLLRIREVPGSILGPKAGYLSWLFVVFLISSRKILGSSSSTTLQLMDSLGLLQKFSPLFSIHGCPPTNSLIPVTFASFPTSSLHQARGLPTFLSPLKWSWSSLLNLRLHWSLSLIGFFAEFSFRTHPPFSHLFW